LLPEKDRSPLQEIAWVLGQLSAEGIVEIIHALTLHHFVGGALLLVGKWLDGRMPKAKRPKRTR